ncbi:hypothetical protein PRIPAC_78570, partial [Pristionchus pacificus]|uniref:G protein-coupled receptor n=1 Tax=Pristionchus pacificus TaxID=54126 RepID=A0A2A6CPV2_PRIPA
MSSIWIDVARILVPIEGLAGMVLNILAVVVDGKVVATFYGPLMFHFPEWINNAICVAFATQVHTMWQILPAPSILQWLALSKSRYSNHMRMVLAYSIPIVFQALAWFMVPCLLPSDEFRHELAVSAKRFLGTNLSDFHLFGVRIKDENHVDCFDVAIFDVIPSFIVCYTVFVIGAFKVHNNFEISFKVEVSQIRSKLVSLGASISQRAKQMQLRFFLTQIAQVLLPLILTSVPLGAFSVTALIGQELRSFPFLIAIMMWPMPMLTALIYLGFVRKTAIKRRAQKQSKIAQMLMSLINTFLLHPLPLYILLQRSSTMTVNIRRGYVAMHCAFIAYELILFFLVRIYILLPYSGLYCEGPLCRMGLPNSVLLAIMSFSIVIVQPPFAYLIMQMHQMFMSEDSPFKLSTRHSISLLKHGIRTQIAMACVQIPLLSSNIVGFVIFGQQPDDAEELMRLYLFYITLIVNFSVLLFFILHTMITLKKSRLIAKSAQTQHLMQKLFEVFYWQLQGSLLNHVIPLTSVMIFMIVDTSNFPDAVLATMKLLLLVLFTLNSTQFCAIFIFMNATHLQILIDVMQAIRRFVTNSKVAPAGRSRTSKRQFSISMT